MEELNKIINGLYAKIDNQEKIIRELQEEIQDLKADYGNLAQIERDFYKQALLDIKEYIESMSDSREIDQTYDIWYSCKEYLLDIVNKAIGSDK